MNMQTRVSAKGQVVIPKDVRDRLSFQPGTTLEVIESSDSVTLRHARARKTKTFEECEAVIRAAIRYAGPPATADEWRSSIDRMFRDKSDATIK